MRADRPSGDDLVNELRTAAESAGVTLTAFVAPLVTSTAHSYIACLARAARPQPLTVERVRALIAGLPIPEARPSPYSGHFDRAARYVASEPSDSIAQRMRKQALGENAHAARRPGETLVDCIRRLAREVDTEDLAVATAEAAQRRNAELSELANPSSLIRRAHRDWPEQSASVAAIAADFGIPKGEAWQRVIAAGIETLRGAG